MGGAGSGVNRTRGAEAAVSPTPGATRTSGTRTSAATWDADESEHRTSAVVVVVVVVNSCWGTCSSL